MPSGRSGQWGWFASLTLPGAGHTILPVPGRIQRPPQCRIVPGRREVADVNRTRLILVVTLVALIPLSAGVIASDRPSAADLAVKPYRVLLVIGDQWKDPTSTLIADGAEFQDLVTLLKSWGVPFDIARLDRERLSEDRFLNEAGRARYGAILWDADQSGPILAQDYAVLERAVKSLRISLIALADRIKEPVIQGLLGLHFRTVHPHSSDLRIVASHFLTEGLTDPLDAGDGPAAFKLRVQADCAGARVLVRQGDWPQVTVRDVDPETRAVWIGGDPGRMLSYQPMRSLLKRALTEAIGYALVRSWTDRIILMMDDLGNAQNAWLEHWHYPALTADQIRRHILAPLKAHDAVLVVNAVPGFADDATRSVVPSWGAPFVDAFGTRQDYRSTKEGLDEGVAAGLIEIHSHGWTHMQPDLNSAPGPWWGTPLDGERAEVGWYREFFDTRRGVEIPAAVQSLHMRRSIEWLEQQFGRTPLGFATGGNAVSTSTANNTWRIAAREGFGWYGGYLGEDFAVQGNANATAPFGGTDDVPSHPPGTARRPRPGRVAAAGGVCRGLRRLSQGPLHRARRVHRLHPRIRPDAGPGPAPGRREPCPLRPVLRLPPGRVEPAPFGLAARADDGRSLDSDGGRPGLRFPAAGVDDGGVCPGPGGPSGRDCARAREVRP